MAEVGVLNLTIHDNSESAGEGLKYLADALSAVKEAKKKFSLVAVGNQLKGLKKSIDEVKGTAQMIKDIGKMFSSINQFSKLKDFTINADKLRETAENMLKLADAKERIDEASKSGAGVSDWRSGMGEISKSVVATKENIEEAAESIQRNTGRIFNIQLFGGRGSKKSEGQIGMDLDGLQKQTEGLVEVQSQIQNTTGSMDRLKESIANTAGPVRAIDLDKYIGNPLDSIRMKATLGGTAMERFWDTFAIKAPTQSLNAMEKAIAGNASLAKKEIDDIIKALDKRISYKGLGEFVNAKTGVTAGAQSGIINESTTMLGALVDEQEALEQTKSVITETTDAQVKLNEAGEAYAGTIQMFDKAEGVWKRIYAETESVTKGTETATETVASAAEEARKVIDLTQIPASGKNGTFANAAEEAKYLQDEIEKTIASQQQWDSIYKAAAKQAKHGGPMKPDDIAFDMRHAAEGYDIAYEAEIRYRDAFAELLNYAKEYKVTVEETVQATNNQSASVETFNQEIQQIVNSAEPALSKIELLQNKVAFLKEKLARLYNMPSVDELGQSTGRDNAINETLLQIGRVNEQIQRLIDKSHEAQEAMQFGQMKSAASDEISQRVQWTESDISNLVNNYSQIDLLELKLRGLQQALLDDINQNKVDTQQIAERTIAIQTLRDKIEQLKKDQEEATESTKRFGLSFKDFKKNLKSAFPLIAQLGNRLKSIIIRRTLTAAIRKVVSSAKEGLQNVYEYSKLIGSGFSSSMDGAASSLAQMKNALGAALAPAVQMLIPVLQQVVSWFINLVNYANQFFALLNGQKTWTRALPQTVSAFDKQKKAAKGAGAAIKDLLADWDELNIIQSESGGGGGAGTTAAEDYLKMFEEVSRFDNKVKDVVNFIKDNFDTILNVAEMIGAAILAWKISKIFGDSLSSLQRLSMVTGLVLTIAGIKLTTSAAEDIAKNGLNAGNALKAAGGIAATALGGAFVLGAAAKALGFSMAGGAVMGAITGVAIGMGFLISTIHAKTIENAYGTLEEDAETIKKNVMAYFNPEADAIVKVRSAALEDENDAVKKVGEALAVLEKDYPVAVTLKDKESLDQLQLDIGNLVLEAKNLVLKRKQNTRDLILNSGQFADSESFIKFSDLQWDKTAQYIEGLGEQMGELISRGITSGAELDGLREKLARIVHAAMYGQRSGEYAGKVSMAGETLRRAGYTKDTVSNYIDTFLTERGYYEDQAKADALAQQAELKALWATVEERFRAGEAGVTQDDVDYAKSQYESFNVNTEIDRLLKLYLGEGDELFAKDLMEGLAKVMEITKNDRVIKSMRDNLEQYAENKLGRDANGYASDLNEYVYKLISKSTGQDTNKLKKLFEGTGLNPFDYLGEFGQTIKDKIADTLINGRWNGGPWFSNEEIEAIAKQFNIDLKDYVKVKAEPQIEDKEKLAEDLQREIEDIINTSGLPKETIAIFNERLGQLTEQQALQDLKNLIDQYGLAEAMKELNDYLLNGGWGKTGVGMPARFSAGMGMSDTGFVNKYDHNPSDPYAWSEKGLMQLRQQFTDTNKELTADDMSKAVENGTTKANRDQNDILNSIQRGVEALLRKNWTVNITPSSALGIVNRGAAAAIEKITGSIG